ncbi:hypothetical protein BO94DRAFT_524214 [Aspergillus sclerotioniger CBS 115572]|uniref:Uncharacterized protein n=1 Tax=Aspergillus sclerotioniger CBS 115572 TaxID=1450535 RepID=A0A317VLR9_9EURO|nr:hypothetical protein BO94DRAFT_524214 [Aspergillus sclerotioniger CBS 115572]PWY75313.1 hypothetical protein BO94DRAFT_524214 [Aspergillus sclerotioniger CBS 115572]
MNHIIEPKERYNLRKALTLMEREIKVLKETETHTLDQSILKQYKIRTLPLSLRVDGPLSPKFFTPLVSDNIPEPTAEYVDHEYYTEPTLWSSEWGRSIYMYLDAYTRKLALQFPEIWRVWSCKNIGDYNFGDLYRTFEPVFGTLFIWHVAKASKPHIKCIMHNDLDVDDDHLLRGKVLTVIRIMLGQLKQKVFVTQMIAPVLLFSLNRRHPRVIEAYFDGHELVVCRTKAYDFTSMNAAGFKTLAQWWVGDAVGDTSTRGIRT